MTTMVRWTAAVVVGVLVVASGCSSSKKKTGETVVGSGVLAQEDRVVGAFTGLAHSSIGDVHITLGAATALRVEAEDNLLDHIVTVVQSGALTIQTESGITIVPTLPIDFYVTVTSLDLVALAGVGEIEAVDLNSNQVVLSHSGVGAIELSALSATDLDVTLSGVGDVRIAGQATRQALLLSGVGDYEAGNLQSAEADVTISGIGDATVQVSTTLDVIISGNGSVYYTGNPVVTSTITGNGSVVKL